MSRELRWIAGNRYLPERKGCLAGSWALRRGSDIPILLRGHVISFLFDLSLQLPFPSFLNPSSPSSFSSLPFLFLILALPLQLFFSSLRKKLWKELGRGQLHRGAGQDATAFDAVGWSSF
jgi:hypothetical protein